MHICFTDGLFNSHAIFLWKKIKSFWGGNMVWTIAMCYSGGKSRHFNLASCKTLQEFMIGNWFRERKLSNTTGMILLMISSVCVCVMKLQCTGRFEQCSMGWLCLVGLKSKYPNINYLLNIFKLLIHNCIKTLMSIEFGNDIFLWFFLSKCHSIS